MGTGFYKIIIKGIVQGVGFRPFIFNLMRNLEITGSITNKGNIGVELLVYEPENHKNPGSSEVTESTIQKFAGLIREKKPEISYIEDIKVENINEHTLLNDYDNDIEELKTQIKIKPSVKGTGEGLTLPPDVAICDHCLSEMEDQNNERFYHYPFIACAQCGPRFTTVTELPYDRIRTTMDEFPLCGPIRQSKDSDSCMTDYSNFENRRFHAQTFSCKRCGPNYFLILNPNLLNESEFSKIITETHETHETHKTHKTNYNSHHPDRLDEFMRSKHLVSDNAKISVKIAADLIKHGNVLAIMGIGGVHLVGLANDEDVIEKMRARKKKRKYKPFAIMVKDTNSVKKYAVINEKEKKILESHRRPIVLLDKRSDFSLPENIAPGLPNIGIMLPYTGIHYLLFDLLGDIPLIFTSGNISQLPMAITPNDVMSELEELADAFLLHNRLIHQRCDDSVLRLQEDQIKIIRRSRGFVPEYIPLPFRTKSSGTIATGPELASTSAISRGYRVFPSQHIGNVYNLETYNFLKQSILHFQSLLKLNDSEINIIACDMHPLFHSTRLAEEFMQELKQKAKKEQKVRLYKIQHHFAHAAGLMVDESIKEDESAVIATLDGVGYGKDGHVWGGEIIIGTYSNMRRGLHLSYIPMIGGDRCVTYPDRMLIGFLLKKYDLSHAKEMINDLGLSKNLEYGSSEIDGMLGAYESNENVAYSSSCGRLLDSISALLDVSHLKTYRGEPAMRLEGAAVGGNKLRYDFATPVLEQMNKIKDNDIIPDEEIIAWIIEIIKPYKEKNLDPNNLTNLPHNLVADIAASALYSIGILFATLAIKQAMKNNIKNIGLTGGVAYNGLISEGFYGILDKKGKSTGEIRALKHQNIPPGDGGISIGQTAIAISKFNKGILE